MGALEVRNGQIVSLQSGHWPSFMYGLDASKTATPGVGDTYIATDTRIIYTCNTSGVWIPSGFSDYAPTARPMAEPTQTVITNFQSGHGYTIGTQGTLTDDATVYFKGNQSVKLTTAGNNLETRAMKTSIAPAIDMTGKYFKVWIQCDNIAKLADCSLYASSDNMTANYWVWNLQNALYPNNIALNNAWIPITLSWGDAVVTGAPNRAAINAIKFRIKDDGTVVLNAWIQGIASITEPSAGVLSFVFDDGWASQHTEARKKLDAYNYPATAFIIPSYIDVDAEYMTTAQLNDLERTGWEISCHDSTDLTSLSTQQDVENTLIKDISWLLRYGYKKGASHFAYPQGSYNESTVLPAVKKLFTTARTTVSMAETSPPADCHRLRYLGVQNSTPTATIATRVTQAINNKEWLILGFHKIVSVPSVSTEYSIANFGTVVDNIATQGISVKTISDVIR